MGSQYKEKAKIPELIALSYTQLMKWTAVANK